MLRVIGAIFFLAYTIGSAHGQTCSQANSECASKLLVNPIITPPQDGNASAKIVTNVIINVAPMGTAKLLVNVICEDCIPASTGIIPTSPLTHFR